MQNFGIEYAALSTLETRRLYLRKARMADAKDIFAYSKNPEVARYVLWDAHRSIQDSRNYIRYLIRQYRQGKPGSYVIVEKATEQVIGTIGFMWINPEFASAEVGYSLAQRCWNQGYMTEALEAVIRYGFEQLGLNRIEGQHDVRNQASGMVMRRAGMVKEGLLQERMINKGRFIDVELYAVLRKNWKENYKQQPNR
ncbi:MAG: GNAT family N-acetyltransferase [Clostridiales bacterium]|nr:GNAT family N-acetyltransferase [Clostridiales bacterium]